MTDLPVKMRGVWLIGHGDMDKLDIRQDIPVPIPGPRDVLIRVTAAGVNNTDINTRIGWYSKSVDRGTTRSGGTDGLALLSTGDGAWGNQAVAFPRIQGADLAGRGRRP